MRVAEDLMGAYQHKIDGFSLIPGPKGVFDVSVNGDVIFSKYDKSRHAEPGELLKLFTSIIGPDIRRYGT